MAARHPDSPEGETLRRCVRFMAVYPVFRTPRGRNRSSVANAGQAVERACSMAFRASFNEGSDHDRRDTRTAQQNAERSQVNGAAWMGQRSWRSPMRRLIAVTVDDRNMSRPHSGDSDANHVRSICLCVVSRRRCGLKCSPRAGTRAVSGKIDRRR